MAGETLGDVAASWGGAAADTIGRALVGLSGRYDPRDPR